MPMEALAGTALVGSDGPNSTKPSSAWRVGKQLLALVPGTLFLSVFIMRSGEHSSASSSSLRFTLFDDAMISMTYARTLAETGEWVWFPGADRVQGFTNPLWTLYMAFVHLVGLDGSLAALAVSLTGVLVLLLSGIAVGFLVSGVLGTKQSDTRAALIAGGTIPFIYPLTYWTVRGMEVGILALLALVATLGMLAAVKRGLAGRSMMWPLLIFASAGTTGIAVRFDFIVILASLLLLAFAWTPTRQSRMMIFVAACLPLLTVALGILAFQHAYWGDWLPNTYYLKLVQFSMQERLARGLVTAAKVLPLLGLTGFSVAVIYGASSERSIRRTASSLVVVGITPIIYSIWVGGDAWDNFQMLNRYVAVGVPALVALFFISLGIQLNQPGRHLSGWLLAAAAVAFVAFAAGTALRSNPLNVSLPGLLISLGSVGLATAILWVTVRSHERRPESPARSSAALCALSLVILACTSSSPGLFWLSSGGQYVMADQHETDVGLAIQQVTESHAVVATHWAGAPAYYARRSMIDMLGKSDRVIATGPPGVDRFTGQRVEFFPGHSKFNSAYSIGQLRPDMVLELPWDSDEDQMAQWGYVRRCTVYGLSAYFLSSSPNVRWERLEACS